MQILSAFQNGKFWWISGHMECRKFLVWFVWSTLHVLYDTKTQLLSDVSVAGDLNALLIFTDVFQIARWQ